MPAKEKSSNHSNSKSFFVTISPGEDRLFTPEIQHQTAAEIQLFVKHYGIITEHLEDDGFVVAGSLQ